MLRQTGLTRVHFKKNIRLDLHVVLQWILRKHFDCVALRFSLALPSSTVKLDKTIAIERITVFLFCSTLSVVSYAARISALSDRALSA